MNALQNHVLVRQETLDAKVPVIILEVVLRALAIKDLS